LKGGVPPPVCDMHAACRQRQGRAARREPCITVRERRLKLRRGPDDIPADHPGQPCRRPNTFQVLPS
jgi:hypothetical protein